MSNAIALFFYASMPAMNQASTFGDRLLLAIEARGVSQAMLAKACGIRQSTLNSSIRRGSRRPSGSMVLKLAEALSVSYEWLLDGKGPMNPESGYRAPAAVAPILQDPGKGYAAGAARSEQDILADIVKSELARVLGRGLGAASEAEIVAGVVRGYHAALKKP